MTAIGLIFGELTADHYEDEVARDPRIDALRDRILVRENPEYSRDYLDSEKRSIANAVQVFFRDGTSTERVEVEYPVGHRRRRGEGIPLLMEKFRGAVGAHFDPAAVGEIERALLNQEQLQRLPVRDFIGLFFA